MSNDDILPGTDADRCEGLEISVRRVDEVEGCVVAALDGEVGMYNAACFHRRIMNVVNAGFVRLVFDLRNVSYYAAPGAGTLPSVLKTVKPHGGDVVLSGIRPGVAELFEVCGFPRYFNIRDTLEEAIAFFSGKPEAAPSANGAIVTGFDAEPCRHLSVSLRKVDGLEGGLLASLSGYLTRENGACLLRRLAMAVDAGFHRLILDMKEYFYTTHHGLASLAGVLEAARGRGGGMILINLPPMEEKVFRILRRGRLFTIRNTLDEAIAFFSR
jgi:anti-sigma B factor antagonist